MDEKEDITEQTQARATLYLDDAPLAPIEVQLRFCGHSFEHLTQVLMGDVHPKKIAFIVFDEITPEFHGKTWLIIGIDECECLEPVFEFGHELFK